MSQRKGKKISEIPTLDDDVTFSPIDPTPVSKSDPSRASTIQCSDQTQGKKSKYADSKWKQQTTPSYKQLQIAHILIAIGIVLLPIGLLQLFNSDQYVVVIQDYTDCESTEKVGTPCSEVVKEGPESPCTCEMNITIPRDMSGRVKLSYELVEFHQHMRQYYTSRDDNQLGGQLWDSGKPVEPDKLCKPFDYAEGRIIYPCGKIANSFFTDRITLRNSKDEEIPLMKSTAWHSDKTHRFQTPKMSYTDEDFNKSFAKPKAWSKETWERFWSDGGVKGDQFVVWMRSAAFATFRNSFASFDGHISTCDENFKGLCKGTYKLRIIYRFETGSFGGRKSFVISSNAIVTDENNFLVTAYLSVGSICIVLGLTSCLYSAVSVSKVKPYYYDGTPENIEANQQTEGENKHQLGNSQNSPPQNVQPKIEPIPVPPPPQPPPQQQSVKNSSRSVKA